MESFLERLESTIGGDLVNVVVDTPSGSAAKFKYDEKCHCYRLSRLLPERMAFPREASRAISTHRSLRAISRPAWRRFTSARKGLRRAKNQTSSEAFHDWRKQTKYLSNAVRLASDGTAAPRAAVAKRAERLADWLGEEHDLAVLTERATRDPVLGALAAARLTKLIERKRGKLRQQSLRLGAKLYAKKPNRALAE